MTETFFYTFICLCEPILTLIRVEFLGVRFSVVGRGWGGGKIPRTLKVGT